MRQILIGADPETFVSDGTDFFSAHDLIEGSKDNPTRVLRGAVQPDGVAAEFNIDPAASKDDFLVSIDLVMSQLQEKISAQRPDLTITVVPTARFSQEYFDALPEEAKALGCSPDYNAYSGGINEKPEGDQPQRTAGGHVHVGWGDFDWLSMEHFNTCCRLVKQLDAILFVSSLLWDSDQERRKMYGKIGAFRPKPFGVEYRPLSNRWLSKVSIQEFIYEATIKATNDFLDGIIYEDDPVVNETLATISGGDIPTDKEIRQYLRHLNDKFNTPLFV